MAICDAAGPWGKTWVSPVKVVAVTLASKFCTTPWLTRMSAKTSASGSYENLSQGVFTSASYVAGGPGPGGGGGGGGGGNGGGGGCTSDATQSAAWLLAIIATLTLLKARSRKALG